MVRAMTKRLGAADASTQSARDTLARAEATRAAVLAEWAGHPGWTADAVAEHTGLALGDVNAAIKAARPRRVASTAPAADAGDGERRPGGVPRRAGR